MLATIQNRMQRVVAGLDLEQRVVNALRDRGESIEPAELNQDKYDKIDGWWIRNNQRLPVQVKVRESGDDILYELMADLDRNVEGRDLISRAKLYLVMDTRGKTRLFETGPIKDTAERMLNVIMMDLRKNPNKSYWGGVRGEDGHPKWEARVQHDRADNHRKLVAYFNPSLFRPIAEWDLKI
jgi:hypothetical protein